jgi:hypothetical protein
MLSSQLARYQVAHTFPDREGRDAERHNRPSDDHACCCRRYDRRASRQLYERSNGGSDDRAGLQLVTEVADSALCDTLQSLEAEVAEPRGSVSLSGLLPT